MSDLCRADALRPVTRDAVVLADPARRQAGRRRFDPRDYTPPLDRLLEVYRDRDLVVKCAPGIDFDELGRLGFSGEIEVTSLDGSVREACLWSSGLAERGRQPPRHHAGRSRADHRRRTRRMPGGSRRPMDRRPRRRGGARRPGPPLRRQARALAARPRHRLPVRRPAARRRARLRGARANSTTARSDCVRRCRHAMRALSRFWCAASTSTPTRCGGGCGCVARNRSSVVITRIGSGTRKSGNGIHMPTVDDEVDAFLSPGIVTSAATVPLWLRRVHRCAFPRRFSLPLRPWLSVGPALPRGAGVGRAAEVRGPQRSVSSGRLCQIQEGDPAYTLSIAYPVDYPDVQAVFDYVKQTRDGFINVAKMPDSRSMPYQLEAPGDRVQLGGPAAGHAVGGVQDLPGRRWGSPADLLQVVQLGSGLCAGRSCRSKTTCSGRAPARCR